MPSNSRFAYWLRIAKGLQKSADSVFPGRHSTKPKSKLGKATSHVDRFDLLIEDMKLRSASRQLFSDGHYARAVEEAFKCLDNTVKMKSGIDAKTGAALMHDAFSAKNPTLKLNKLQSQSDKDEQRGYMDLYAGSMTGIRNPRAHEHELEDSPEEALEMLIFANHLMRKLRSAAKRLP